MLRNEHRVAKRRGQTIIVRRCDRLTVRHGGQQHDYREGRAHVDDPERCLTSQIQDRPAVSRSAAKPRVDDQRGIVQGYARRQINRAQSRTSISNNWSMTTTIRQAQPDDAELVADAHITAWRVAYRGVIVDEFLDSPQFAQSRRAGWHRRLHEGRSSSADPCDEILVPVLDGRVVGFGHVGAKLGTEATNTGELYGFYLHPDAWGSGAAASLIEACHAAMVTRFKTAELWVLRDNPRARRFYERHGWSCGSGKDLVEDVWVGPQMARMPKFDPVPEVQYRRNLADVSVG